MQGIRASFLLGTQRSFPYLGTGDNHFHLTPLGADQGAEFLTGGREQAEAVVLCERGQKVLDGAALVDAARVLLQLGHNLGLVGFREGRGLENRLQLRVGL